MSFLRKLGTSVALAGIVASGSAVALAPAASAATVQATCQVATVPQWFTGKNPKDCSGTYVLIRDGKEVLRINNRTYNSPVWTAMKAGNRALNDYCVKNPATCGLVTAVGIGLALPLIGASS